MSKTDTINYSDLTERQKLAVWVQTTKSCPHCGGSLGDLEGVITQPATNPKDNTEQHEIASTTDKPVINKGASK